MKAIWEASDIIAGRRYGKPGSGERWMIGYQAGRVDKEGFVSISLSDGMVVPQRPAEEIADGLTVNGYMPEELLPPASGKTQFHRGGE